MPETICSHKSQLLIYDYALDGQQQQHKKGALKGKLYNKCNAFT